MKLSCPICHYQNPPSSPCCLSCDFPFHSLPLIQKSQQNPSTFKLADYHILGQVGKGGMGEVFLAYEKSCCRLVALKRIKPELKNRKMIYQRFLREAKITSQLSHPAIIPIYALGQEGEFIYYTMPYLENDTLRDLMKQAREKKGHLHKKEEHQYSIPSLIRYFLPICQAIAYAHSKSVIHRDIKPENVLVGKYGEVLILDWGLAKYTEGPKIEAEKDEEPVPEDSGMTLPGKVVGTVAYMAPERALGVEANIQSDIYSLGVILYQILTLHFPFKRGSLTEFRNTWHQERWTDPSEVAPYREVPKALARIAKNCLYPQAEKRYKSVEALIEDLENYLEGRGQWLEVADLDIHKKEPWQFQENILIPQELAITPTMEKMDWVNLMIAKQAFLGNTKVELSVTLDPQSKGIGLLMGIPEPKVESFLEEGYCLWLSSEHKPSSRLFKTGLEIIPLPQLSLKPKQPYHIKIEKIDQSLQFFLDQQLIFTYHAHLPLIGPYLGIIGRDLLFELSAIKVFVSSLSIKVNCLKVPDTLLACKNYSEALKEYRQIAQAFPGRTEGREAMFRAGICLLERAKTCQSKEEKEHWMQQSLLEFSNMHTSPAAPLEYLGKALVYQEIEENEEETKCYELAFRRYSKHPLIYALKDHLVYRLYQSANTTNRLSTYHFTLLLLQHFDPGKLRQDIKTLIQQLCKHWESLYAHPQDYGLETSKQSQALIVEMAYRLSKSHPLIEMIEQSQESEVIQKALFYLMEMGYFTLVKSKLEIELNKQTKNMRLLQDLFSAHQECYLNSLKSFLLHLPEKIQPFELMLCSHMLELGIKKGLPEAVVHLYHCLQKKTLPQAGHTLLLSYYLQALLLKKEHSSCQAIFAKLPPEDYLHDSSLLHFTYGCFLAASGKESKSMQHFSNLSDKSFPLSIQLGSYFVSEKLTRNKNWFKQAFTWEKKALYRQLSLYYHILSQDEQAKYYAKLEQKLYTTEVKP